MPIVAEKLTHIYAENSQNESVAIKDVNLKINEGEFWGIIGHTGSGKSTLVQHLNALMQPTSGTICVDGNNLKEKKNRKEARKKVGLVFQYPEYQLFEETVLKDIAYGPINMGESEENAYKIARDAMKKVGLNPEQFEEKSPFELSGGEKRRVAIAGIIAMQPKYLVLDEPMAGLDPRGRREILLLLKSLRNEIGCAVIMISHSMDDIAAFADHVAVLNTGRLVKCGSVEEVFSDMEELKNMGLDVPQAALLSKSLKDSGVKIEKSIYTVEQMAEFVLERAGGKSL